MNRIDLIGLFCICLVVVGAVVMIKGEYIRKANFRQQFPSLASCLSNYKNFPISLQNYHKKKCYSQYMPKDEEGVLNDQN